MDVDLSTDLNALLPLLAPLLSGHSDVAIGTRLARGARVIRGPRREIISRCYNLLLHATLGTGFSDAQCGFKAIRADAARAAAAADRRHRLVLRHRAAGAGRAGRAADPRGAGGLDRRPRFPGQRDPHRPGRPARHRPPRHRAGPGHDHASRCWAAPPRRAAARGGQRPAGQRPAELASQLARFVVVGVASTAAYVLLYLLLRGVMAAQAANAVSLLITAIANTAANRRFTFGIRGRAHAARHQLRGLIAFGIGLARHLRRAGGAARGHRPARPGRRGRRARRGQPGRHRGPVRALPGLGLPQREDQPRPASPDPAEREPQ